MARPRRHGHRLAGLQPVPAAADRQPQLALDDLVALARDAVDVRHRDDAARAAGDLELDGGACGGLGGLEDLDAHAEVGDVVDGPRSDGHARSSHGMGH
jgi:hypothetical protein